MMLVAVTMQQLLKTHNTLVTPNVCAVVNNEQARHYTLRTLRFGTHPGLRCPNYGHLIGHFYITSSRTESLWHGLFTGQMPF